MRKFGSAALRPMRLAIVVAATAVATVGLTWLLEIFLSRNGGQWATAIQAVGSVVLVGVTAAYVRLTARLVVITSDRETPIRFASQHQAASEALDVLVTDGWVFGRLASYFPVDLESIAPDASSFVVAEFDTVAETLQRVEARLPAELHAPCFDMVVRVLRLRLVVLEIGMALQLERETAERERRLPTWAGTRTQYEALPEKQLKWDYLCSGEIFMSADRAETELARALIAWLRATK